MSRRAAAVARMRWLSLRLEHPPVEARALEQASVASVEQREAQPRLMPRSAVVMVVAEVAVAAWGERRQSRPRLM